MKRILALFAVVAAAFSLTSCLDRGQSTYKYTVLASLDYDGLDDDEMFKGKTYFCGYDMYYDVLKFYGKRSEDKTEYLGGFAYAYQKDTVLVDRKNTPDPFTVYDCDKKIENNHFMIYRKVDDEEANNMALIKFEHNAAPESTCTAKAVFIANTTLSVVRAAEEGAFGVDDWATVTIEGYLSNKKTESVTVKIFDKGTPIKTWTKVDLEALGNIDCVRMKLDASKPGIVDGFAMDLFVADVALYY